MSGDSRSDEQNVIHDTAIVRDCEIGNRTEIWAFANLYECKVGSGCMIGPYVEVQRGAVVADNVSIQSHAFICESMEIQKDAWIGHGVMTINNRYPPGDPPWEDLIVGEGAVIGSNATLFPVNIGENAIIGAGAVVTEDVPADETVVGNPAQPIS
mgnify:CR=1 FL=1